MNPLLYAREKVGMSQLALAKAAKIHPMQVYRIEQGRPAPRAVAKRLFAVVKDHITLMDLLYPENFRAPRKRKKAA